MPHGRIPGSARRDSYEVGGMSPAIHHRVERCPRQQVREHGGFRSTDAAPFYRSDKATAFESSPRLMSSIVTPGKYALQQPTHLARNRSYEDRYKEIPPPFRSKAAPPGWMDGIGKHSPSPMMVQPVRILRNPERERERERESRGEFVDEHVTRSFNLAPRPEHQEKARPTYATGGSNKAQYLGESIHSLAPSTSIGERVRKFISTLHPERPDPPVQDEPYDYPYTQPCDPSTLPAIKHGRNFPVPPSDSRSGWVPESVRIPAGGEHTYFGAPLKAKPPPQEKRRRHRARAPRREYDEASSQGEDCARRLYRLHT
ncbi:hypothetical protein BDD12DRAFT_950824 [Trichophaea hybrida]|nr:hypothetical protein BDD12DRAFT_950824 [Trichophaea hybrida]